MTLEEFLDHHMDKDVHDVIIVDEQGNEITLDIPEESYQMLEVIVTTYLKVARVKLRIGFIEQLNK